MDWTPLRHIALISLLATVAHAQPATQPATPKAQPKVVAHLVTFSPGREVWERFGHNAIFMIDLTTDQTCAYDFGNFDFNDRDFIPRFIRGDMRYWSERKDPAQMWKVYSDDHRQIWAQQLRLPDEQLIQLWKNLEDNVTGDSKFYRYDYYADNCSTRIRDHIDRVTGGALKQQLSAIPTEHSYRWQTRIGMESAPWLAAGVEFSTSQYVDRPLSAWEAAFVPAELMKYIQLVNTSDGKLVDVATERNVYLDQSKAVTLPAQPPVRWPYYFFAGLCLGAAMAVCGMGNRESRGRCALTAVLWGGWGLIAGVAGLLLVFFWVFTSHRSAYANENLLQLSPVAIALVVIGPLAAYGKAWKIARILAVTLVVLAVLGVLLKMLPWFGQDNWRVIWLALPAQIGLIVGVWHRTREIWDIERVNREFGR